MDGRYWKPVRSVRGNHSAVRLPALSGTRGDSGRRDACGKLTGETVYEGSWRGSKLVGVEHVGSRVCGEQVGSMQVGGEQAGSMLSANSPAFHSV